MCEGLNERLNSGFGHNDAKLKGVQHLGGSRELSQASVWPLQETQALEVAVVPSPSGIQSREKRGHCPGSSWVTWEGPALSAPAPSQGQSRSPSEQLLQCPVLRAPYGYCASCALRRLQCYSRERKTTRRRKEQGREWLGRNFQLTGVAPTVRWVPGPSFLTLNHPFLSTVL